jgi:hypothetical protein
MARRCDQNVIIGRFLASRNGLRKPVTCDFVSASECPERDLNPHALSDNGF